MESSQSGSDCESGKVLSFELNCEYLVFVNKRETAA